MKNPVQGSAQVVEVVGGIPAQGSAMYVNGEMRLIVTAEGVAPTPVHWKGQIRCSRRPQDGDSIPVTFDRADPGNLKIHWSDLPKAEERHQQQADQRLQKALAEARGEPTAGGQPDTERQADEDVEEARQIWRDNLARGYCTQEEFDKQMRELDQA